MFFTTIQDKVDYVELPMER